MRVQTRHYRQGIRVASPVASVTAAASGTLVLDVPPNRTAQKRKITIYNHNAAPTNVTFGTGLAGAFVAATVPIQVLNGMTLILQEEDIPSVEYAADITASCSVAAVAPGNVEIQIEAEEYIGTSG